MFDDGNSQLNVEEETLEILQELKNNNLWHETSINSIDDIIKLPRSVYKIIQRKIAYAVQMILFQWFHDQTPSNK